MRLERYLERQAVARPDKLALVAGRDRLSYRELHAKAVAMAAAMAQQGVSEGDRVVLLMDNTAAAVISLFPYGSSVPCPARFTPHQGGEAGGNTRKHTRLHDHRGTTP